MKNSVTLKKTPIKEIIFTISYDETLDIALLEKFKSLSHIKETFTNVSLGFHANIEEKDGQKPETSIFDDGFILKTEKSINRILHVRRGFFAFHKVNEYEKFDTLLSEFEKYWKDFINCAGPLTVNNVSVRYLNFIEKDSGETNQELVNIHINHPFANDVSGFINIKIPIHENLLIKANLIVADVSDNDSTSGIILDIILNKPVENSNETTQIFSHISELRPIKNQIFFNCVTPTLIKKYNQ